MKQKYFDADKKKIEEYIKKSENWSKEYYSRPMTENPYNEKIDNAIVKFIKKYVIVKNGEGEIIPSRQLYTNLSYLYSDGDKFDELINGFVMFCGEYDWEANGAEQDNVGFYTYRWEYKKID